MPYFWLMHASPSPLVLAIDGGGTRCRVAASTGPGPGTGRWSVETGSANVSTDFAGAVRAVRQGLDALAARMTCPPETLSTAPAFVGLAGVTGPGVADRLRAALPLQHVTIADDRPAAVRGVLGARDGVIGHCGTGSFFAAQAGTDIRYCGGWGPVLGDEASAQWAGRMALSLTLQALDGRADRTPLCDHILSEFGDAAGIVRFAGTAQPADFGALAPLVTDHAGRGDAVAQAILHRGGDEITRALRHLGWRPGQVVCLTGGIGPHYAPHLAADLRAHLADPEGDPLDGALSLARDLAQDLARAGASDRDG